MSKTLNNDKNAKFNSINRVLITKKTILNI